LRLPTAAARESLQLYAAQHPFAQFSPDPRRPYEPGDPYVHVIATTFEEVDPAAAPRAAVPWERILLAAGALAVGIAVLVMALVDAYLLAGVLIFLAAVGGAAVYDNSKSSKGSK
jgi:hypothetical protein